MEVLSLTGIAATALTILDSLGLNPVSLAQKEVGKQTTEYVKNLLTTKPTYKNRLASIVEQLLTEYRTEYNVKASDREIYFFQTDFLWQTALTYALFKQDSPLTPENFPALSRLIPPTADELTQFSARLQTAMNADAELEKRFTEENYKNVALRFAFSASGQLDELLAQTSELLARPDAQSVSLVHAMLDIVERDYLASYKPVTAQRQLRNVEQVLARQSPADTPLLARLHFLLGRAHQELGEVSEADRAFLQAFRLNPDQLHYAEEAARAYANQRQPGPAQNAVEKIEDRDPLNPIAAAVRLALGNSADFDHNLQSLPATVAQNDQFKLTALQLTMDGTAVGSERVSKLLHQDMTPYRPAQLTGENRRYQATLALSVVERALRHLSPVITLDEPPTRLEDYYVLGMTGWLLTGDLADYAELRRRFPSLPVEKRQRYGHQLIFTLYQAGEYQAALEMLELVDTSKIPELGFIRYTSMRRLKRPKIEARAALEQHLNELPQIDDLTFQRALIYLEHCESVAERQDFVDERERRQQVAPGLPMLILRAHALTADPTRHDEVRTLLDQSRDLLLPETPAIHRQTVASLYHELKDYDAAATVLEGWPGYPLSLDQGSEWLRLNNQYHRRSDSAELREDLRAWRSRYGIYGEFCIWEIQLAELLLDWERVLEVVAAATGHLTDTSGLIWAKLLALYKLGRNDALLTEIEQLVRNPAELHRRHLFQVAGLAAHLGEQDWVKQLLYPLASKRDDMAARGRYAQLLLGHNQPGPPLPEFDRAVLDTMVYYSVNGTPQRRLALTDETVHGGLNNWAEELLDKEKGKKYVLAHPATGRRMTIEILEIHDLYTGLLMEILEEAKAGNPELPFEQFDVGDGGVEQLFAALSEAVGAEGAARQLHNRQLFAEYENGETTFTALTAAVFNNNGLEAYHVLTAQQWPDVPGLVVLPRLVFDQAVVDASGLFILDWTSLPLLYQLDKELAIKPRVKLGISLHIVEFLQQKRQEMQRSQPVEISVEIVDKHVRPHFYAPEVHERQITYLTELLEWIETNCVTRIVTEKLDIVREMKLRESDPEGHMQCLLDTAFLAAPAGAMVVSDDAAFLQFSWRPGNIISTEVFLTALYPEEFETVILPKLLDLHYLGLTLSGATILREFIQAGGQFTGRALQCLKNLPRQLVTEPGAMAEIITLLRDLYLMSSLLPAQKSRAATTILTACLTHIPLTSHLKSLIRRLISVKFQLLPVPMRAVLTDFEQAWQVVQATRASTSENS
jgi:Tetratricopeptide repeat